MATNRETLLKFINAQSQRVQDDISQQGYKRNSPYVDRPQNVIKGQPGQPTQITMQGVDKTLMGIDEYGNKKIMHPGQEYEFPGSEVTETAIAKNGGTLLTKTITCNNCGWKWKAADGGNDIETCHKCGHENTIMQNGGEKVVYNSPEYAEAYKKGEVQSKALDPNNPDATWWGGVLDDVKVKSNYKKNWLEEYRDKIVDENKDAGVLGAIVGTPISALFSLPQMAVTSLFNDGNPARPSEVIGFDNKEGLFDSPTSFAKHASNFVLDAVTDPTNLIGAGILTKEKALESLINSRNIIGAKIMDNQIAKGLKVQPVPRLSKIDLIDKAAVNVENDMVNKMTPEQYDALISDQYNYNAAAYNNPIVEYKGYAKPNSFFESLDNGTQQTYLQKMLGIAPTMKQGLTFKEKFCLPGSECAKSANAVTNRTYTDITGAPFNVQENAHNAWHMEDQMTRHGGQEVSHLDMKVGDRVLMGNGVDQSTFASGYVADRSVRHAGMYAGVAPSPNGGYYPLIFESGKNNAMYVNPFNHTFTGPNSVQKVIRPEQFVDDTFGKSLAEKNIRYAFRDKPSVANYTSDNAAAQKIIDQAEKHREVIKRTHDITNDEFDELRNSLIGIGAQETKLSGALPGSKLAKAKIQLQDQLTKVGLTKPIKKTLNAVKQVLNDASTVNSNLPKYPGTSVIEMEAAKLSHNSNIPFNEALSQVKSSYQPASKYALSTPTPSKGMFRQKFQTELDRVSGLGTDLKSKNSIENGLGQMAENYAFVKQMYPDASSRQLMDLTTLMWNSPGKVKNKSLVDFYLMGKNNPDPSKFNFDYVRKINDAKNDLINIQPQRGATEPYYNFFRNSKNYPEIQYEDGGDIEQYQVGGQKKPIYVESKNDPRYKAYSDSLYVHTGLENFNKVAAKIYNKNINKKISNEDAHDQYEEAAHNTDKIINIIEKRNFNIPVSIPHWNTVKSKDKYGNNNTYDVGYEENHFPKPQQQIIVKRPELQSIENSLQPIGIQNAGLNIETELPQIRQQVRQPKYYDVEDYTQGSTNYNGTQSNYRTDDLSTLSEQSPNNTRKVTPRYDAGGSTYQYAPVPITNGDMYDVDLTKEEDGGQQDMPAVNISPELNTIVQLANDDDKIEQLMKITGKSKQNIQNSIINIFDNLNANLLQ